MKTLFILAALLMAGCSTPPSADPPEANLRPAGPAQPEPREAQVLLDQPFQVDPAHPATFEIEVPDPGRLHLVYQFEPAAYKDLEIDGPGACDVNEDSGGLVFVSHRQGEKRCEAPAGPQKVSVRSTGVIAGRLTITG